MDWTTHTISNQVPDLQNYNLFSTDTALREGLQRHQADWHSDTLQAFGAELGKPEIIALGELANRHLPELSSHDRTGHRVDKVDFHPAWHELLSLLRQQRLHALPWQEPRHGAQAARAAGYYLQAQIESGSLCPTTMTFASIPVLQKEPALFEQLKDKLYSDKHDARDLPLAQKHSILIGMGMTEKQGGSDVRTNTTRATLTEASGSGGRGQWYQLTGHKWFFSAPMCDAHLVLAHSAGGLSCFFVPRWRADGSKNPVQVQRLKDKLGNRSNSSSEVEFLGADGLMIGEEGRGIPTIIEMANLTRLDCVIGSSALMRQALTQAIHHARHRHAFGKLLAEQPLMQNVLADLALESEAATTLMLRLASAVEGGDSALEQAWRRIMTPAAKFWVCKRAIEFSGECMEVWGGNGYVENGPMARLYREAPVNSIWEGSGNVMCLDVLRAIERDAEGARLLLAELAGSPSSQCRQLVNEVVALMNLPPDELAFRARLLAQKLVLAAQCHLLAGSAPDWVAESFARSRSATAHGRVFGGLDEGITGKQAAAMLERAFPQ